MANSSADMANLGIVQVDGLPYVLAVVMLGVAVCGIAFAFLVIWGYKKVGIQKQAHVLVYVVIATCCIMSSFNAFFVSIGLFSSSYLTGSESSNTKTYETVLCILQTITSELPRFIMVCCYVVGMSGRIISTYAPLDYYRYFRYGVVWKLIALGIAGALLGLIAEIFVVQKQYSDNVGMCTSSTDQEYATVHVICVTLAQLFAVMFLIVSYILIIRKYVRNKVNVAGHLSDDSSKGILIAAGSYTLLSAFVPHQILIVMYLLANITIGAYMMKERNMTSSESLHNKETFFFLRLSTVYILVLTLSVAYYCAYIYYHIVDKKPEADILHSEYNALILFYIREISNQLLGLINMVQMWKHTYDLREQLSMSFLENLNRRGAFKFQFVKGTKLGAYLKMNNIKLRKPSFFKRKRKLVRTDGRLKFTRRTKYRSDENPGKQKTENTSKTNSMGRRFSLKRLGSRKSSLSDPGRKRSIAGTLGIRAPGNRKVSKVEQIVADPVQEV
ncbi:hypothetical protein ACHWQZ_G014447 [Mnemiopsis leidyi]